MADILISTTNLTKKYGSKTVVDNVTLQIERGAIVGLVGQNGAGKTTLIRMLTGLVKPTAGSFELLPNLKRGSCDVAAIVERPSIYTNLTAMDNLKAQSLLLGLKADDEYLKTTLNLVGLDSKLKKPVKNFSLGMKQRLSIAMTLVGKPQLLILDEPTNGLDPEGIAAMREIFVKLNSELGVTLVVSSHILSELGKFATEFYIMDSGKILKRVTADELKDVSGKRIRLTVNDTESALKELTALGDAKICGDNQILLLTDVAITQVMLVLAKAGIEVKNFVQTGDALEDYYLDIVRAAHNQSANQGKGGSL